MAGSASSTDASLDGAGLAGLVGYTKTRLEEAEFGLQDVVTTLNTQTMQQERLPKEENEMLRFVPYRCLAAAGNCSWVSQM